MKYLMVLFLGLCGFGALSQANLDDSLRAVLRRETVPETRFHLIDQILEAQLKSGGNIDTSLCIEMMGLAQTLNEDSLMAIGYNMAGSFNARKGDYPSSLEFLFKAIPMAEKAKDKRRISSLYFNVSLVYLLIHNLKEAFYYNLKGRDNLPDPSSPTYDYMKAQFERNMVRYYLMVDSVDLALPYLRGLEERGRRLQTPVIYLPSLFLSGATYARLGMQDSAYHYFKLADDYLDSVNFYGMVWSNDKYYLPFLIQEGKIQQAKIRALQLLKLGVDHKNPDVQLTALGFLKIIYDKLHRTDSAYYYSNAESGIKDEVYSQNNLNKEEALAFNERLRSLEEKRMATQRERQREQYIGYGAIGVGILLLVILFLFQLRERKKEMLGRLADQRERISKELHDNVGSQLTYVIGNIDLLIDANNRLTKQEELSKLRLLSNTSKTIVNELRETIWAIKKESIRLDELADKIKSFLKNQMEIHPGIHLEIQENIQKDYLLQPNESLNAFRICQEAINNCLRHAGAENIRLEIYSDARTHYRFSLSDDGTGFDPALSKEGHYGLENMKQRALECGASLTVWTQMGKGTRVILLKQV